MAELKIWNGSNWVKPTIKIWDGTSWVLPSGFKIWANGAWVDIFQLVTLRNANISNIGLGPRTATISLQDNGVATESGLNSQFYNWGPTGSASDYDARLSVLEGDLMIGSGGVWQNLGTTRTWGVRSINASIGYRRGVYTLEIRPAGGGSTLASATIVCEAECIS